MEGGFQKSLQLFVVNGCCVFEDDLCVDLSGVIDGKPNYANIPFLGLFARPCVDQPEVMDEGPDYATTLLSEFCATARCPHVLASSGVVAIEVHSCEEGRFRPKYFRFFFFFDFLLFIFFFLFLMHSPLLFLLPFTFSFSSLYFRPLAWFSYLDIFVMDLSRLLGYVCFV